MSENGVEPVVLDLNWLGAYTMEIPAENSFQPKRIDRCQALFEEVTLTRKHAFLHRPYVMDRGHIWATFFL